MKWNVYQLLGKICLGRELFCKRTFSGVQINQRSHYQIVSLVISSLLLLLLTTQHSMAADLPGENVYELLGEVVAAPADRDGYGEWQIQGVDDQDYLFVASRDVTFSLSTIPVVGETVSIKANRSVQGADEILSMMVVDIVTTLEPLPGINRHFVKFSGSVIISPLVKDGLGRWQLFLQNGQTYNVDVHAANTFIDGVPVVGQDVYVQGWRMAAKTISAETIQFDDGTIHQALSEQIVVALAGEVVGEPLESGDEQLWYLRTNATVHPVRSTATTIFSPAIPQSGTYVHLLALLAEKAQQPPLALEITADTFAVGEILVRLQPAVAVTTVADHYHLLVDSILLASGDIFRLTSMNPTVRYLSYITAQLQADPRVRWAELNYIDAMPIEGHPHRIWGWGGRDDRSYINQAAFAQIKLGRVHELYRGDGQIVAVLDTGVDLDHPALQTQLLAGRDMVADDALPDDEGPGDAQGHGTHVSGIIIHIAPASRILPVRVLDADGRGNSFIISYAIEWAVQQGADVINLSAGTVEDSQLFRDTVEWAAQQGVSVVTATGNSASSALHYPAAYPNALAVTAVDEAKVKASFANYGPWVDFAAPGVGITSTIVTAQGSGYGVWSGTSMATPFVSGAVALLREKFPEKSINDLHQWLRSHSEVIDARNPLYAGQVGTFLNIEASMQDEAPASFAFYFPIIIRLKLPPIPEDPR